MGKNYKTKYLFAWILVIFLSVISEIRLSKGDTNHISIDQKTMTESPRYSDHSLSVNDFIETDEDLEFPMMLRDFITKTNANPKITVENLNPGDSLLFEAAIPNGKTAELLITNNKQETVDVFNADVSAIYVKEYNEEKFKKSINNIHGVTNEKLADYDVVKLTNGRDADFEFSLDKLELVITPR